MRYYLIDLKLTIYNQEAVYWTETPNVVTNSKEKARKFHYEDAINLISIHKDLVMASEE